MGLADRPFPAAGEAVLGPDPVFVVTGAAGSIVSAITADLAAAHRGTFHLLDLTPEPDPADPDLRRYAEDRDGLKSELADRMRQRGERPTPVLIERELSRFERLQAALAAVQAVESAGGTAHYHSVDLTDADAVGKVLAQVRDVSGRVDVLLHAAGVEVSHALPDKEPREFDLVLGVKGDGWFNVLHGLGDDAVGHRRGVQFGGRPVRQRRTDRLQRRQRPAVQGAVQPAPHPSRRAHADARLDRVGGHRHGHPWVDPDDHGGGGGRHAARRSGRRVDPARADAPVCPTARSSSPGRWARWPASSTTPVASTRPR